MFTVRNAVFALLFVNLAFMAWAHWIDVPFESPVNPTDAHRRAWCLRPMRQSPLPR